MTINDTSQSAGQPAFILNLQQGPGAGQQYVIEKNVTTIGRDAGVDVSVDDSQISRHHATLTWTGDVFVLKDLNSSNGTFVNGERITGLCEVQPGDVLGFGTLVQMGLQVSAPVAAAAAVGGFWRWLLLLAALLVLCIFGSAALIGNSIYNPRPITRPVVLFHTPLDGASVTVGDELLLHAVARGEVRISRLEIWIDDELYDSHSSTLEEGTSPLPHQVHWTVAIPGEHTLTVRAFNVDGERSQASVRITALALEDVDGDGVVDGEDACPTIPGSRAAEGCPDRDGDGIADADDSCPDTAGLPEGDGCPVPTEGDRDGDGVLDESDTCPDEPGAPRADGCPDADGDGIGDAADACPDEPGFPGAPGGDGCPAEDGEDRDGDGVADVDDACVEEAGAPSAEGCPDRDGDGITDAEDACPDDPGPPEDGCPVPGDGDRDGDGIADADDRCPDEAGTAEAAGCPDRDGDGVADSDDACPDDAGAGADGCAEVPGGGGGPEDTDSDGDGVLDREDSCPAEPGDPENAGCPEGESGDRDGDGVEDDVDLCLDEAGLAEHGGCPRPGEGEDSDGDGILDDEEGPGSWFDGLDPEGLGFFFDDVIIMNPVEFEALTFRVDDRYDEVNCYASLAGSDMERYGPFDPLGDRSWDIAAYLGGENSRQLAVESGEALEVRAECTADTYEMGPGGGWGSHFDLGSFAVLHTAEEWDGRVLIQRSSGSESGRSFEVEYRICAGNCDSSEFPPPILSLLHHGSEKTLIWSWDGGDRDTIDGFKVYMDGNYIFSLPTDVYTSSVRHLEPLCGLEGRREFSMTAYRGDLESPHSNLAYWSSQPCPRSIQVTFEGLSTFYLGDDEWWADGTVGPIYGNFSAEGSNAETLSFFAVDYGNRWGERDRGYRLRNTRYYPVQGIFDWVHTQMASCLGNGCPLYTASEVNFVTIELGPYDDLTFGAWIRDVDSGNADDTLFDGQRTLDHDEIRPGLFSVRDRNMELTISIDVMVGPQAGADPDLTITDVTQEEESGQLRIHVFNNASDLIDQDMEVRLERLDGTHVVTETWETVTIPSGGSRILQGGALVLEPSDLRVILDPEDRITESNEDNNIYETPVTMRVEFISVWAHHCNENSCSIFDCDSEHVFHVYAGFGTDRHEVNWVGRNVRFPEDGHLRACGGPAICDTDPDEDWRMEGNERYIFEFEMPADEDLFIMVTGAEQDTISNNDSLGYVLHSYGSDESWGDREATYSDDYGERCICDDTFCIPCSNGLTAWWRITRVR